MIQFSFTNENNKSLLSSLLVMEELRFTYDGNNNFTVYTKNITWLLQTLREAGFENDEEYETSYKFNGGNYNVWGEYLQQAILVTDLRKTPIFFEQSGISKPVTHIPSLDGNLIVKDIENTYELMKVREILKSRSESDNPNTNPLVFGVPNKILRKFDVRLMEDLEKYAEHNLGFLIREVAEDEKVKLHEVYMKESNTFI